MLPPSPGMVRSGGGARLWFPASPQLLQCAIFRPAESSAENQSWQGGVELPTPESTHISLTEGCLLSRGCDETPAKGTLRLEVDRTTEFRL